MKIPIRRSVIGLAAVLLSFSLMGVSCTSQEYEDRQDKQTAITLDDSLGIQAQQERLSREEDTTAVRYVYVMPIGSKEAIGYYVIKGGVYDASTQLAPEQEIICKYNSGESCLTVDSARDNGTFGGEGGDGFFFFTSDGVLVELAYLAYLQQDQPIAAFIDVPRLYGTE